MQKTPLKTPQLNGLAERMNWTIEEKVRCTLSHDKLSKFFWGETVKTVIVMINHSQSVPLNGAILEVGPNRRYHTTT